MESNYGEQPRKQTVQSITLHMIASVPSYVSNHILHSDLKIQTILETAKTL